MHVWQRSLSFSAMGIDYSKEASRLQSFNGHDSIVHKAELACLGFYLTKSHKIKCNFCHLVLKATPKFADKILPLHQHLSPHCPLFLPQNKNKCIPERFTMIKEMGVLNNPQFIKFDDRVRTFKIQFIYGTTEMLAARGWIQIGTTLCCYACRTRVPTNALSISLDHFHVISNPNCMHLANFYSKEQITDMYNTVSYRLICNETIV